MTYKYKKHIILSFLIILIWSILSIIFAFIPFGNKTMLTIDLGQQYIDFYSLYKEALTNQPQLMTYSFQKAIGGEMIGLWTYYLSSPFNLILLFFNESNFQYGVSILIIIKFIAIGNSFLLWLEYKYKLALVPALIFSLSYTFMSYSVLYMLNIMWLDGLIWLPIIGVGLDRLLRKKQNNLYIISLAILMISNYYIAYMVCIFLAIYTLYNIIEINDDFSIKLAIIQYFRFLLASITSVLIAGIVLVPTFFSLLNNKASQLDIEVTKPIQYTIADIFSKIFIGSFTYEEISSGSPNIYTSTIILLFMLFYFFNKQIKLKERMAALFIFLFFIFSFQFEGLDLLWHGGQFPIWYDFRFSFIFTFFIINLAIKSFLLIRLPINKRHGLIMILSFVGISLYYFLVKSYPFLQLINYSLTFVFLLSYLIIFHSPYKPKIRLITCLIIVIFELTINSIFIISQLSYVDNDKFVDYVDLLSETIELLVPNSHDFYRIHKTYSRTKNEAFYAHYYGLDHFSSTLERNTIDLYGFLGQPDGSGFVTYSNGTLFLDDFLGVKYLVDIDSEYKYDSSSNNYHYEVNATDLDNTHYPLYQETYPLQIFENKDYLPLAIEVSSELVNTNFYHHHPIYNQNQLINLIDYRNNSSQNYFSETEFKKINYHNVNIINTEGNSYYTYENSDYVDSKNYGQAYIRHHFNSVNNHPYYLTIPSQYSNTNVSLSLNDQSLSFYSPFRSRQIFPITIQTIGQNHYFDVNLLNKELTANQVHLYEFDLDKYQEMLSSYNHNFNINEFNEKYIKGTVSFYQDNGFLLFTIPYDSGWNVKVNNRNAETISVLNDTLLAIPMTKGEHIIELSYQPVAIQYGIISSVFGIIIICLANVNWKKIRKS